VEGEHVVEQVGCLLGLGLLQRETALPDHLRERRVCQSRTPQGYAKAQGRTFFAFGPVMGVSCSPMVLLVALRAFAVGVGACTRSVLMVISRELHRAAVPSWSFCAPGSGVYASSCRVWTLPPSPLRTRSTDRGTPAGLCQPGLCSPSLQELANVRYNLRVPLCA
jgi:hypothetical protein